jgi:hypothetical protein
MYPNPSTPCTLASETVATVPANRARTRLGVGEEVVITVMPPDLVAWSVSGGGRISTSSGTATTFTAGDRASTSTVTAIRFDGSSCTMTFTVVEPSTAIIDREPGTGICHVQGTPSAGFKGRPFVQPDDVSFENVEIREGLAVGVGTGHFRVVDGLCHAAGAWVRVGRVVPGKGARLKAIDTVQGVIPGSGPPFVPGIFDWPIPWEFRVAGGAAKAFTTVNHHMEVDAAGTFTISKGGARVTTALNEPTSSY